MRVWPPRIAGLALITACLWYLPWLVTHLNREALWLGVPFAAATLLMAANVLVAVINNWHRSQPVPRPVPAGAEPDIAVVIPTYGEPVEMVERTLCSVFAQDWPAGNLLVLVSDDGRRTEMAEMVATVAQLYPQARVLYHEPAQRGTPQRRGEAKAGNLNSALTYVHQNFPDVAFIETRDADDMVGSPAFLRQAVGQLMADTSLAYVQTIKEAKVGKGDPFGNLEPLFYRGAMHARHAANAVFPCGSGLVWRKQALLAIDGFPAWNLVEDLQSGVEALRRGWRSCYLPIIGAIGQTAPEDIPNVYKQRGTWALDTMRLLLWGNLRGLNLRQRLHFVELGLFYLQGLALLVFLGTLVVALISGIDPVERHPYGFVIRFWPYTIAVEAFLAALNGSQRYEALWRLRQVWLGLAPVYVKACFLALVNHPDQKPAYRVTRKDHQFSWYWRETVGQIGLLLALGLAVLVALTRAASGAEFDPALGFWAVFYSLLLAAFTARGWYGVPVWNQFRALSHWRPNWQIERWLAQRPVAPLTFAATVLLVVVVGTSWAPGREVIGALAESFTTPAVVEAQGIEVEAPTSSSPGRPPASDIPAAAPNANSQGGQGG